MVRVWRLITLLISGPFFAVLLIAFAILALIGRHWYKTAPKPLLVLFPLWAVAFVAFLIADALFNITFGSLIYWERPREWLLTDRMIRHKALDDGLSCYVCQILSILDPGHC